MFGQRQKIILLICAAVLAIGGACQFVASSTGDEGPISQLDREFYDWFYTFRCPKKEQYPAGPCPVVILASDNKAEEKISEVFQRGWPWPRGLWGSTVKWLEKSGAKAVVFDLTFKRASEYEGQLGDDEEFADAIDACHIPVIFATAYEDSGPGKPHRPFAPPTAKPVVAAASDVIDETIVQHYLPYAADGTPSLALAAVTRAEPGIALPAWTSKPFLLEYYGRYHALPYQSVAPVILTATRKLAAGAIPADPAAFKGKIVVIGTIADGTFDQKAAPMAAIYPGVEIQATAIINLLRASRVIELGWPWITLALLLTTAASACGSVVCRRAVTKIICGLGPIVVVAVVALLLFTLPARPLFLKVSVSILSGSAALLLGLAWSFLLENREAKLFIRALGQYVSRDVAAELRADPTRLSIGTETRELTILFSDIAGFTTLSEKLGGDIGKLLNEYLDIVSEPVFDQNGTLDKYIGDAVMAFWNAPVRQEDHAIRACRAALAMQSKLKEGLPRLIALGADSTFSTRIGVATGTVAFGNMGSPRFKFNYSVIGDAANFASRLEGSNKVYGSRILIGETTAALVKDKFTMRKLDRLRVVGKQQPVDVFELLCEGTGDVTTQRRIDRYQSAFAAYLSRDWDRAEAILLENDPAEMDDPPIQKLLQRVRAMRKSPPGPEWDGVHVASEK
jgi:adenylate cyclase